MCFVVFFYHLLGYVYILTVQFFLIKHTLKSNMSKHYISNLHIYDNLVHDIKNNII